MKNNSLQDRGMIIRFSNKAKGFSFPLGTFIIVIPNQLCSRRVVVREKGPGQLLDITPDWVAGEGSGV